jgi:hypothetical protein
MVNRYRYRLNHSGPRDARRPPTCHPFEFQILGAVANSVGNSSKFISGKAPHVPPNPNFDAVDGDGGIAASSHVIGLAYREEALVYLASWGMGG